MKEKIEKLIEDILPKGTEFSLEPTANPAFGHYATNVAMKLAPLEKKAPLELAEELATKIKKEDREGLFESVEAVRPGFINFRLSLSSIQSAFSEFEMKSDKQKKGTVVIDYSNPNIAKPMSVAHVRSTIIGDALYRIFTFAGWKTISDNHLGDWGKQFGVLIAAYKESHLTKVTIDDLLKLYVDYSARMKTDESLNEKARLETKKLQGGDRENTKIWKEFYKVSLDEFKKVYKILDVKFDYYLGESFYNDMLEGVVQDALEKGIAKKSEGAVVIPIEGNETPFVIQKSDEAFLYSTTDLAAIIHRNKKFKPNLVLYVVDNGQSFHFTQLFKAGEMLGYTKGEKLVHVKFGLILGDDMKKLSTRAGKVVSLTGVLDEAIERALKVVSEKRGELSDKEKKKIAEAVGIAAVKYNDLSQNRQGDIAFNWDKMLNFEGNSAPYLMYTYARLKSILREAKAKSNFDVKKLNTESETSLILKMIQFPDVVERITEDYFPHHLTDYLFELAQVINHFYHKEPVLKAEKEVREARLVLVSKASEVLKTGLGLLGIKTVEEM